MDKYSEMSPGLRKVAVVLLKRAAEEFSNHGCNDFDLSKEAKLTVTEAIDVRQQVTDWLRVVDDPKHPKLGNNINDWLLMQFIAAVLENE